MIFALRCVASVRMPAWGPDMGRRVRARRMQRHGQHGGGYLLPAGHQHVHLPVAGIGIHLPGQLDQVVPVVSPMALTTTTTSFQA